MTDSSDSPHSVIRVRGARTHNLKNIDVAIPRGALTVITGPSGSGKSSLAFDTLYAEGQRRYVESLSAYARQFLSVMDKPDVDEITGLSPAIAIQQKTTSHNPRSTVGTATEIYDYLRLLFARIGTPHCPEHGTALSAQTVSQMVDQILHLPMGSKWMLLAPVVKGRKGNHQQVLSEFRQQGFLRACINGTVCDLDNPIELAPRSLHHIALVIDRFSIRPEMAQRLAASLETALKWGKGWAQLRAFGDAEEATGSDAIADRLFSQQYACPTCGFSVEALEPKWFSFNSPQGACALCNGLGESPHFEWDRLITEPQFPLTQGAIPLWMRTAGPGDWRSLRTFLHKHRLAIDDIPVCDLPEHTRTLLTEGDKTQRGFPGFSRFFAERYRQTESDWMREELLRYVTVRACEGCGGSRLRPASLAVRIGGESIAQWTRSPIGALHQRIASLQLSDFQRQIADRIVQEIQNRLSFLVEVGLHYLSLDRRMDTLSGGEAQRIRLASQIGSALVGVLYVLDEPTIGLHQRDNARLLESLLRLKHLGNTVVVVEHDEDTMRVADHLIDIGPGAGVHGGTVVASGTPQQVMEHAGSLTGAYLSGRTCIPTPIRTAADPSRFLVLQGASANNLQQVSAEFPLGLFTVVTGVSGSGKSTLINDTLYPALCQYIYPGQKQGIAPSFSSLSGQEHVAHVIAVDQTPIGRTPRSNPATYTGILTPIREWFAALPESRIRGYTPGRFSFNVKGGRCEACEGDGLIRISMHFLSDVYVACEACEGKRYNRETLEIQYHGKNIADVLDLTVDEALGFFDAMSGIQRKLATLQAVGLGYIRLGQSATTLSGGEAQRIKLAKELSKRYTGHTVYILDEPTTGLHFQDVALLIEVLLALRSKGHSVIAIEHHLDFIKSADWVLDLGPEGGAEGGRIVACGTPEQVAENPNSVTGAFLRNALRASV